MWPSKKRREVTIPPGKSLEIGFSVEWRKGKDEVVITTGSGEIVLDGKNELFLEVAADNADTVKLQIIPDFKNRILNVVEVVETNVEQTTGKNKGKIAFVGMSIQKDVNTPKDVSIPIGELLKKWDENIESYEKKIHKHKRNRNLLVIFGTMVIVGNAYLFTVNTYPMKYLNGVAIIILIYSSIMLEKSYRRMHTAYEEYKENRSQAFEVVKDK